MTVTIISSCSMTTFIKTDPISDGFEKKLNAIGENKQSRIVLKNGDEINESFFKIDKDSIFLIGSNYEIINSYSVFDIHCISYKDRIVGLGYGALYGGVAILLPFTGTGGAGGGGAGIPLLIGAGMLVGGTSGYFIGSRQYFEFKE